MSFAVVEEQFVARADEHTRVVVGILDRDETLYVRLMLEQEDEGEIASLTFSPYRGIQISSFVAADSPLIVSHVRPFSQKWYALFRLNCWLSGCNVRVTPAEKAECIQGISREEIDAWNLKV